MRTIVKTLAGAGVNNPDPPSFENTIEVLEYSGELIDNVANVFVRAQEFDFVDFSNQIDDRKEVKVGAAIDLGNVANDREHFITNGNSRIDRFFAARHCCNHKKARYQRA